MINTQQPSTKVAADPGWRSVDPLVTSPSCVWGISVMDDQQIAGLIMKIGGSTFMWVLMGFIFFARFSKESATENSYRRTPAV